MSQEFELKMTGVVTSAKQESGSVNLIVDTTQNHNHMGVLRLSGNVIEDNPSLPKEGETVNVEYYNDGYGGTFSEQTTVSFEEGELRFFGNKVQFQPPNVIS